MTNQNSISIAELLVQLVSNEWTNIDSLTDGRARSIAAIVHCGRNGMINFQFGSRVGHYQFIKITSKGRRELNETKRLNAISI